MLPSRIVPAVAAALVAVSPQSRGDTPDAVVTFNEIHYHPADGSAGEWIELHNAMAVPVDLSRWSLAGAVSYRFPTGSIIEGGGRVVVAKTPAHASLAGVPGVTGPFTGSLPEPAGTVDLLSPTGRLMDRLSYAADGAWPAAANGAGATLAKRNPTTISGAAENWRASRPTPGARNFPSPDQPVITGAIMPGSIWRYHDGPAAPPNGWAGPAADDSGWQSGGAPFASEGAPPVLIPASPLVGRYRAGAVTGVADGSVFSPWLDTATADGVSQDAVAISNPEFEADATPSGEPVIDFDGNDAFRTSLSPGIPSTSGFAYFVVCRAHSMPDSGGVNDGSGAYLFDRVPDVDAPLASLKAVSGRFGFQTRYDDNSGIGGPVSTTAISTTQYQIVAVRRNVAQSRFEVWVDGILEGTSPDNGSPLTPQPIVIGRHGSQSNGFDGDIAEVLVYRDALDDAGFQAVGSYLEAQYGLDTAFPGGAAVTQFAPDTETSYLRKSFQFTGDPARTSVELEHTLADGAVFYLNGQEVSRSGMPGGPVGHGTPATADIAPAGSGRIVLPGDALVSGTNVLAVSLHTGPTDSTAYFHASLRTVETPVDPDAAGNLVIHEMSGTGASAFFVEVRNPSEQTLSSEGLTIGIAGASGASYPLPAADVPPGGFLVVWETQSGFRPSTGDLVVLRAADGSPVDARAADSLPRGLSSAWSGRWLFPQTPTPGQENAFPIRDSVVIHEICYNPPDLTPASADQEWIELHHTGTGPAVNLGGWRLAGGVDYAFPSGSVIAPGGYLVIAKSPGSFPVPAGTVVIGPWSGSLANGGETITLVDASGNPADEVPYIDGGRWPGAADGNGSTIELRDPRSDNALPESWAASDERSRRSWQTYSYRMAATASAVGPDSAWREFVFGLLDSGELLLDDLQVIEDPDGAAVQMIANGNFSAGTTGWRFLGNHRHATVVSDPDNPGNPVLHLSARGPTEHMHNHVETTLANGRQVVNGRIYEIRYRARWLEGSNRLNTRLYFNRCARTTALTRTGHPGTPGAPNSTAVPNAGPGFAGFTHAPAVPAPGQPVTVSVRASDPDGVAAVNLHYTIAGGEEFAVPMQLSQDGVHRGQIPGQSAGTVIRFHVSATDAAAAPAVARFPADGPASHALCQVDDGRAATNGLHNIRIIMTAEDKALLYRENNLMSNERLGCTVIVNESEIHYDIGVRLKSSQRGRPIAARVGFNLGFPKDRLFRGVHRTIAIDRSEGQETGCREILFDHSMAAGGSIPAEYNDLCKVLAPDPAHTSSAILQMARFGSVFLDSQFENGSDGTAWEYELVYYPLTTDAQGYKLPQPDNVVGTDLTDLGDDKENYRWTFLLENNEDRDDYSRIIAAAKQFSKNGAAFEAGLHDVIDAEQWILALAHACTTGAGDSFFSEANHNGIFYARPDGRVLYFPHDMDFAFDAQRNIFENSELRKLTADPGRRRLYLGLLHHLCTTQFNRAVMAPWSARYGALLPGENFASHLDYIDVRSRYILNAVAAAAPLATFAITTNGGNNFSTSTSPVTLEGTGWIDVKDIRLAGATRPLAVTWLGPNSWRVQIPVSQGENPITLEAVNFSGEVVGTDAITVTSTSNTRLPDPASLVVSAIYYNPPGSTDAEEYIELMNISAHLLDLGGCGFSDGITCTFPSGTVLAPGARLLAVKNVAAFQAAFGPGLPVAATFPDSLDNAGERLLLTAADGSTLRDFSYSDDSPWPMEADGAGYALVLVDPYGNPDHNDPRSWRASVSADGGSPGSGDILTYEAWKLTHGNPADDSDADGDGLSARLEYFMGGDPGSYEPSRRPEWMREEDGSVFLSFTRLTAAAGGAPVVLRSADLASWSALGAADFLGIERERNDPATDRLYYRIPPSPGGSGRLFFRVDFGP